jgi:hypothetical protein
MRMPRFSHNNLKPRFPNTVSHLGKKPTFFTVFGDGSTKSSSKLMKAKLLPVTQKGEKLRERERALYLFLFRYWKEGHGQEEYPSLTATISEI